MENKEFSQQQIREILAKASELQRSKNEIQSEQGGVTSDELREIADEVGISSNVLEKAIRSVESSTDKKFNWLTGTSELKASIILEHEANELQINQIFPELNTLTGQKGTLEKVGNTYDWEQLKNEPESIRRITIIPKGGKTKVVQYVNWNELRFLGLGLSAFFGSIALIVLLKSLGVSKSTFIPLAPLGGLVSYYGFMGGLKYIFSKQKEKFDSIMQLVTDSLERPAQHRVSIDEKAEQESKQNQRNQSHS